MPGNEPRTSECEARTLPLCYATPLPSMVKSSPRGPISEQIFLFGFLIGRKKADVVWTKKIGFGKEFWCPGIDVGVGGGVVVGVGIFPVISVRYESNNSGISKELEFQVEIWTRSLPSRNQKLF